MRISEVKHYAIKGKEVTPEALGYSSGVHFKGLRGDPVVHSNWIAFTSVE